MYRVPKIQLSIQGIWSNTSFIKVEGQNDEVDVKNSIIQYYQGERNRRSTSMREKKVKINRWSRTKFPGPVTP